MSPRANVSNGKSTELAAHRIAELEEQLDHERSERKRLEVELTTIQGGAEGRMSTLANLLLQALDNKDGNAHFYNPVLDDPAADRERCWLQNKTCDNQPGQKPTAERIRHCTECDKFNEIVPDSFTRVGELINSMLFLLQEKHQQFMETQQQLVQSEKLAGLGELAAGLAHEINNPTGIILSRLDLIELDHSDTLTTELRDDLHVIRRHADRLQRITKSLTSFARRHKVEKKVVVLQHLMQDLLEILERTVQRSKVTMTVDMPEEPMIAFADATMIQQVFMNIILNARDAMPGGGELKISGRFAIDGELEISFRDSGTGMDNYVRSHVFDPFFTTKETRGTGLGLSVSYGIIKDHGGEIEVESEPGKGATFRILIPAYKSLEEDE